MSEFLSDRLPQMCVVAFNGRDLEQKFGDTYLLLTSDPDGTPRPCMLSAGELLGLDDRTIRLALWTGSHTVANLARGARAVICFVAPRNVLYIKGIPRRLALRPEAGLEYFEIRVERVDSDVHEGMPVTQGIKFTSEAEPMVSVLKAWQKILKELGEAQQEI